MVVGGREPAPPAGEGPEVDGVAQQLALGHQGVDDLLVALARFGALHPASTSVEVAHDVAEQVGRDGDVEA